MYVSNLISHSVHTYSHYTYTIHIVIIYCTYRDRIHNYTYRDNIHNLYTFRKQDAHAEIKYIQSARAPAHTHTHTISHPFFSFSPPFTPALLPPPPPPLPSSTHAPPPDFAPPLAPFKTSDHPGAALPCVVPFLPAPLGTEVEEATSILTSAAVPLLSFSAAANAHESCPASPFCSSPPPPLGEHPFRPAQRSRRCQRVVLPWPMPWA